jgi:hypothetical protein
MKVENLLNDRLNRAANQFVITTENGIFFQSYESMICKFHNGRLYVTPKWNFSNTTRRHFYIFLRDYCGMGVMRKQEVSDAIESGLFIVVEENELELARV